MSFIFAKKYKNRIRVFADNKMTVKPNDEDILTKFIGVDAYKKIKALGIIKNVIINRNICISSTGILEDYNELLKYVDEKQYKSFEDICNKALEINVRTNNRTNFIICSINGECRIVKIDNCEIVNKDFAWIGSKECTEKLQEFRLNKNDIMDTIYDCETKKEMLVTDEEIDRMAFLKTLQSKVDDDVGEIMIECVGQNNKFSYLEEIYTTISKPKVVEPGKPIKIYDNVFDGGFTCHVYNSSNNYKIYIEQISCGVEFCPYLSDEKYNHLRIPKLDYCTVEEFEKNHNCEECSIIM